MKLEAGRELDALIAEKVFGRKVHYTTEYILKQPDGVYRLSMPAGMSHGLDKVSERREYWLDGPGDFARIRLPYYSTNIGEAWDVVEKIKTLRPHKHADFFALDFVDGTWEAGWKDILPYEPSEFSVSEKSDTAPHAICLAALKAVGIQD